MSMENHYLALFSLFSPFPFLSSPERRNGGPDIAVFYPELTDTRASHRGPTQDRDFICGLFSSENSPEDSGEMELLMFNKSVKEPSIINALAA